MLLCLYTQELQHAASGGRGYGSVLAQLEDELVDPIRVIANVSDGLRHQEHNKLTYCHCITACMDDTYASVLMTLAHLSI